MLLDLKLALVYFLAQVSKVSFGEVAEWFKALAWKACSQQCVGGSNPFLSAI